MTATPTVITQQDPSAVSTAPAGNVAFVSSKGNRTDTMAGATEQERQHTDWKDILRAALRQTHSKENLSTLLFLLDSLTYLRTLPTPQDDSTAGGQPDGKAEDISQFYGYLKALYLPPSTTNLSLIPSHNTSTPFCVHLQGLAPLATHCDEHGTTPTHAEIRKALRPASVEALKTLQETHTVFLGSKASEDHSLTAAGRIQRDSENTQALRNAARDSRDQNDTPEHAIAIPTNHIDFSSLPEPNKLLQSTLARALSETQASRTSSPSSSTPAPVKKSSELPIDVGVQRWALSSLLHHYLGEGFGQIKQNDGVTSYARNEKDDIAIREFFPDPRRFSLAEAELASILPTSPSIASSLGHGPDASMSSLVDASKSDDKLKWLLGEFVPTHTVRRRTPLPAATSSSSGAAKGIANQGRMIARSPTAYQPRRRFIEEQDYLSDAELQEVVHYRRRSSSARSAPLTPPHRRAWSADSDLANLRKEDGARSPANAYPSNRESFDASSHRGEWQGGSSLSRMNSYDTYDSQSRLITQKNMASDASEGRFMYSQKVPLDTVEDRSPDHSPTVLQGPLARDTMTSSTRPFMNLYLARPSSESVRSEPANSRTLIASPTTNDLSAEDKQHLVRTNRKLKAMLGEAVLDKHNPSPPRVVGVEVQQIQERYTESLRSPAIRQFPRDKVDNQRRHVTHIDSEEMARSASIPLKSPKPKDIPLTRSLSVGSSNRSLGRRGSDYDHAVGGETSQLSPIAASFVSDEGSITSPSAIIPRSTWTDADGAREARRRKLVKIQAFLGERVPASAISEVAGKVQGSPNSRNRLPMFSKASHKLQRRLTKSKHSGGSLSDREIETRHKTGKNLKARDDRGGSHSMDERSRSNSQTSDTNPDYPAPSAYMRTAQWQRLNPSADSAIPQDPALGEIGKAAEPVILAVRRARKLEKVFGSLPPSQLYARTARWIPGDNIRFASDNVSLASRTSRPSIHRARVASIRFIVESEDPELVNDFARVVLSEESDASDPETGIDGLAAFGQPGGSSTRLRREHISAENHCADEAADLDDDGDDDEEYLSAQDKTFQAHRDSHDLDDGSAEDAYRSSMDTDSSQPAATKLRNDFHTRLRLLGTSPSSPPSGMDLLQQRFDRSKTRKNRDSVLSGVTAHSSAGSAYAVDGYGKPQRSQSRASHSTSAGNGTPRSSMDSVRIQFRRAHKLATVFGTTRGEVFNRVLDDIEADIAEADDEEIDEEEKREIIESVAALRASL